VKAVRLAGIGGKDTGTTGIRDDCDSPAARDRLVGQERRNVDMLFEPFSAGESCVAFQRLK
jgi:hypothetical protein